MNLEELSLMELNVQEQQEVNGGFLIEMHLEIFALGFYVGYKKAKNN